MQTVSSALAARIAKLRAAFLAQVPSQLAEARDLLQAVGGSAGGQDTTAGLKRIFHNLKGSGGTFGLKRLSAAAEAAELLIEHLLRESRLYSAEFVAEVGQHIATIDWIVAQASQGGDATSAEPVPALAPAGPRQGTTSRRLVYVCDDDEAQAAQIQAQLSCFGYSLRTFSTLSDLREAVIATRPDAVIMDVVFPEGEDAGPAAVQALQPTSGPLLPTVFVSGRSDLAARLLAVKAGGIAFLTKPLHCLDIVEHLDALTSDAQPEPFRVLVVDDEPHVAALHASILEDAGMLSHVANNPEAAIEALREFRPELVLMDMYMPGCTGRELAQVIRQMPEHLSLPIVYLSSETDTTRQRSALAVGADGFLVKPIDPGELVSAVVTRAERMRILRAQMVRDSLTGLFNHTATKEFLEGAVATASRRDGRVCFAMIDVDHFKSVNDTYGHPVGDHVLLGLSRVLRQQLRQSDLVGRYGGEEFAVVLLDVSVDDAWVVLDRLRQDFESIKFWAGDKGFSVTFSCGVAEFPGCDGVDALCELADKALYVAKRSGRNRVVKSELPGETA